MNKFSTWVPHSSRMDSSKHTTLFPHNFIYIILLRIVYISRLSTVSKGYFQRLDQGIDIMAELKDIEAVITALGDKIKSLKASGTPDKDVVDSAIKDLLAAKRKYAENNNGIGVDGKPFEEPLTKAQQKAKAKAGKDTSTVAEASGKQVCSLSVWFSNAVALFPSQNSSISQFR
jgi:WHEP-TRS domain